jgi:putative membrane protein
MMFGWSMGLEGWMWMGIWILVLAVLVWCLVREPRRSGRDDAMDILRARLARGEISTEEFEHARALLDPTRPQEHSR